MSVHWGGRGPGHSGRKSAGIAVPPFWTPANLGTAPSLYLEADSGVTQAAGAVSAWLDQSANAYSFAQATGANQPAYSATMFNGAHPGVKGDGVNDFLQTSVNFAPLADGWQLFWLIDDWTAGYLFRDTTDAQAVPYVASAGAFSMYDGLDNVISVTMGNPMLFQFDSVGAGTARLNGTDLGAQTGSTQTIGATATNLNLFAGGGAPANFANATIAVLIAATAMSAGDREKLEGWAAHKYGVTSLLPAGHPYKSERPRA